MRGTRAEKNNICCNARGIFWTCKYSFELIPSITVPHRLVGIEEIFMQVLAIKSFQTGCICQLLAEASGGSSTSLWHFNPVKLTLLIGWVYLCLYCVQRVEFSPLVAKTFKPIANVMTLVLGPVVLALLAIFDATRRYLQGADSIARIFKEHVRSYSRLKIFSPTGTELRQAYTAGRTISENRMVIKTAEQMVADALDEQASNLVLAPKDSSSYLVSVRISGVVWELDEIESELCGLVIDSIKAVAGMDVSEKQRHQDGGFVARTADGPVCFRASSNGVSGGEKLSIRILNQDTKSFNLGNIGLSRKQQALIKHTMAKPFGTILICGPVGCGKTTTLYAMINNIDLFTRGVVSVEDPVECLLPNVNQVEVNPKAGMTFANSLSALLRHDPDVVIIDEIRDRETAAMALEAARSNQLILATINASSTASALLKLLDLSVSPTVLSAGLSMIISQRLIRQLCGHCKTPAKLSQQQIADFYKRKINYRNIYQAVGCDQCRETGYQGQTVIFDILDVDDQLRASIMNDTLPVAQLRRDGDRRGRSNLQKQGLLKVVSGITSLEELNRVTG